MMEEESKSTYEESKGDDSSQISSASIPTAGASDP